LNFYQSFLYTIYFKTINKFKKKVSLIALIIWLNQIQQNNYYFSSAKYHFKMDIIPETLNYFAIEPCL